MSSAQINELKCELGDKFQEVMTKLTAIWDEIGICETKRDERMKVVKYHLDILLEEMLSEEENLKSRLVMSVTKCSAEIKLLCEQLSLPAFEIEENATLLESESALRKKAEKLEKIKKKRLEQFEDLTDQETRLCHSLSVPRLVLSDFGSEVPSMKDLEELQQHVDMLKSEKTARQDSLHSMKTSIKELMTFLEYSPTTQLECDIICDEEAPKIISADYLTEVENLLNMLKNTKCDLINEAENLRNNMVLLWNRLNVDQDEQDEFMTLNKGCQPSIIKCLKKEIARCEEMKRQNMHHYIQKTRDELLSWWECCFISKEQRSRFTYFNDDTFSEELLSIHENEVQKMKEYYEANKEMLIKVEKREELWKRMIQFEKNAMDPKRFNNRGGALLQEEHERKKLLTKLPKLEEELAALISEWEATEGRKFLVHGQRFLDYVASQWEQHRQEKENEKVERKRARAEQLENELVHGIKSKNSTPLMKRVASQTPTSASKRLRTHQTQMLTSKSVVGRSLYPTPSKSGLRSGKKLDRNAGSATKKCGVLKERNQADDSAFSITAISVMQNKPVDDTFTTTMASYTEFTENLNANNREFCRSSMVSPALRPAPTKKRPQTPGRRQSPRLSVRKTPKTPLSSKKTTSRHLSRTLKSPATPIRHNLGLPFLI